MRNRARNTPNQLEMITPQGGLPVPMLVYIEDSVVVCIVASGF